MTTYSIIQKSQLEGAMRLDAEYYQPEYLELEQELRKTGKYKLWADIAGKFITGPFGSEFNVESYVPNGKYRYVRGKDVKEFFLKDDDNVYIPKTDFERLKKYSLQEGDILISVVGTLGNTAIVDKSIPPAIFSCKSTAFRTQDINPFYFIAYLNSKYGQNMLERSARGALQTGLNIDDLKFLPVFLPEKKFQDEIADLVKNTKEFIENSKSLYQEAENLLLEELGMKDWIPDLVGNDMWWTVNFSEVQKANRMDAEYFQSKYEGLIKRISKKTNLVDLNEIATVKRGSLIPPSFYDEREGTPYLRGKDFSSGELKNDSLIYINKKFEPKNETRVKTGDVIFASIGSVGTLALVREEFNNSFISNNTAKISLKDREILPEYFALSLHSIVGQWQFEREASQTAQPKISDLQVENFLIPVLPKNSQQKIAELVRQSHEARKKAGELLEEAKHKVEELIEKGK